MCAPDFGNIGMCTRGVEGGVIGRTNIRTGKRTLIILDIQKFLIHHIDARSLAKIQGDWVHAWFKNKEIGLMPLRTHQLSIRNHLFLCSHSDYVFSVTVVKVPRLASVERLLAKTVVKLPKINKQSKHKRGSEG